MGIKRQILPTSFALAGFFSSAADARPSTNNPYWTASSRCPRELRDTPHPAPVRANVWPVLYRTAQAHIFRLTLDNPSHCDPTRGKVWVALWVVGALRGVCFLSSPIRGACASPSTEKPRHFVGSKASRM